jgi:hypothetical protein
MDVEQVFNSVFDLAVSRPGRHTNKQVYFKTNNFYRQFRIVYAENRTTPIYNENSKYPHIFCAKTNPQIILNNIDYINKVCGKNKNIIYGATDTVNENLYDLSYELKKHFDNIFLEALRKEHPNIKTWPMGFTCAYIKKFNKNAFNKLINCSYNIQKEKLIGTAFGNQWPILSNRLRDRINILEAITCNKLIENFYCDISEYHIKKSQYLYFASPQGNGIQSPKIYESMMCETIPVLTDAPYARQLRDLYNLPIYIIDEWENLNEKHLIETYENKYKNYDWYSLKKRFHVDNFIGEFLNESNT